MNADFSSFQNFKYHFLRIKLKQAISKHLLNAAEDSGHVRQSRLSTGASEAKGECEDGGQDVSQLRTTFLERQRANTQGLSCASSRPSPFQRPSPPQWKGLTCSQSRSSTQHHL